MDPDRNPPNCPTAQHHPLPSSLTDQGSGSLQHDGQSFNYPVLMSHSRIVIQTQPPPNFTGSASADSEHRAVLRLTFISAQ